jgi:hypothetical protein
VSRALWRAHAGHDTSADLAPIYAEHADAVSPAALEIALDAIDEAPALAEWQVEAQTARALAVHDEREIAWERSAVLRLPEGAIEYSRAPIVIANATDRAERQAVDAARAAIVERELAPLRRERLERERDVVERLGIAGSYVATFERLSGLDLGALATACESLLTETAAMWDDVLPAFARRRLGTTVGELTRADALALFRAPEFDPYFSGSAMLAVIRTQLAAMGLDPSANGRVRYDVGERAGKRSRAFCAPVRVPDEVHLVLRPQGGAGDWRTLLHEIGHSLHFSNADSALPFEHRWAGDNSVTEGYAMLFDHLLQDGGWLMRQTELGRVRAVEFARSAAFEELHFLRRYAGKLLYELRLYEGDLSWDALAELYVETLGSATRFQYRRADAFVDVDPRFYSARYLRAWQLQASITETLRERFDADWWRNPSAGPFLVGELWALGQRDNADVLSERVAGRPLSFAPVIRAVEASLA